jgi:hypothetical protein
MTTPDADLKYAALVCGLMLALAACTRALALLPVELVAAALELAALAQLAICVVAVGVLLRRDRKEAPPNFMDPDQ